MTDAVERNALPPALAAFMRDQPFVLLIHNTNQGAVLVLKAPRADIDLLRGKLRVRVTYTLHQTEYGPVIRLVLDVHDRPGSIWSFETFCNPDDPNQLHELEDLISRPSLRVLCYDETLTYRLGKRITQEAIQETAVGLAVQARRLLAETQPDALDFMRAKQIVLDENPIGDQP